MVKWLVVGAVALIAVMVLGVLAAVAALVPVSRQIPPVASFSTAMPAQAASLLQEVSGQRAGISVTGEGSVMVKPDVATVTLGVEVSNPSAATAQQEAAAKMDAVMAQLKQAGIPEKDIQTVRFDLSPEYDYSTRSPVLKGYRVTNLVAVIVRDVSKVGSVLDAVVASGATRLQGIRFSVSDPAAAGAQGREEAMNGARAKAEQLAKLSGVTLGRPIAIEESVSAPPTPMEMDMRAAPAAAAPETPISPGMQEVRTVVRVTYAIQ